MPHIFPCSRNNLKKPKKPQGASQTRKTALFLCEPDWRYFRGIITALFDKLSAYLFRSYTTQVILTLYVIFSTGQMPLFSSIGSQS